MRPLRDWSLATRFAAVTLIALLATTLVNFTVTFSGPPPLHRPVALTDLLPALQGEAAMPPRDYGWVAKPVIEPAFTSRQEELTRPATRTEIARLIGAPVERIGFAAAPGKRFGEGPVLEARDGFTLGLRLADGSWRVIRGDPAPLFTEWHMVTLGLTTLGALIFAFLARMVARSVVGPLNRLGEEADMVGLKRGATLHVDGPPEVVRVSRAVAAMRDRLADALESRIAMFTAVAHDMAAPLARLQFRLADLPDRQRDAAERDIAELSEMISGILALASTERMLADPVPLDLVSLARDVAVAEGLAFRGECASGYVMGDPVNLRRLVTNLCVNAKRYAGGGEVVAQLAPHTISIAVRDRGPGLPFDAVDRIFEPFFRLEPSRSRKTAGVGLGLSIARNIAIAHGGELIARNQVGGGAEFLFTIASFSTFRANRKSEWIS